MTAPRPPRIVLPPLGDRPDPMRPAVRVDSAMSPEEMMEITCRWLETAPPGWWDSSVQPPPPPEIAPPARAGCAGEPDAARPHDPLSLRQALTGPHGRELYGVAALTALFWLAVAGALWAALAQGGFSAGVVMGVVCAVCARIAIQMVGR